MKKTLLSLLVVFCFSFIVTNSQAQTNLFSEDFSSGILPSGWTNDSAGAVTTNLWLFNNPYQRAVSGAGFDTSFAIFDSDEGNFNDSIAELTSLTTPDISLASMTGTTYLELDEQFRTVTGTEGSARKIEFSTDGGASWTIIIHDSADYGYPNPATHSIYPVTLTGASNVRFRFTYSGTWDWWWAIDNVELVDYPAVCTTPPNAGTTGANTTTACSWTEIGLYLIGADSADGTTFQWQSSPDGTNWTDIAGETYSFCVVTGQTANTYYHCNVICSGQTAPSISIMVDQLLPTSCYCIPEYANGCDALAKVQLNTLINLSGDCDGTAPTNYTLFPDTGTLTTDLGTGDFYDITIASGPGSGDHSAALWIDFNADGDFQDAGEFFHISDTIPEASGDFVANMNVPMNAVLGLTRMRVRYIYSFQNSNPAIPTSDCTDYGYGETEDYMVNITVGTGMADNPLKAVKVYPVPAHERIFIQSPVTGSMNISILDQTGRLCREMYSQTNSVEMDVKGLSAGVYFIRFDNEKNTITKKIVIN